MMRVMMEHLATRTAYMPANAESQRLRHWTSPVERVPSRFRLAAEAARAHFRAWLEERRTTAPTMLHLQTDGPNCCEA